MDKAQSIVPILRCKDITKSYGSRAVLGGVSLELGRGETVAIMGRSGCGKSTLLRCISLLEDGFGGSCELNGQVYRRAGSAVFAPWQVRREIAMVFQDYNLFPNMTVERNISLALRQVKGLTKRDARDSAHAALESLGISHIVNQYPESISGGEAQRVALARAIVLQPAVLLLDEVTSSLDPESVLAVIRSIRKIREVTKRGDLGILLVTHYLSFAVSFSDRIIFMNEGKFVEDWPADEFSKAVSDSVAQRFVQQAMGNWVDV